jgi:hypothetical protein
LYVSFQLGRDLLCGLEVEWGHFFLAALQLHSFRISPDRSVQRLELRLGLHRKLKLRYLFAH